LEQSYVRSLFDAIASRYDFLNHLLSGGLDIYWRRKASQQLSDPKRPYIIDVATGTADFAIAALRSGAETVVGVDISEEMLKLGRAKVSRLGLDHRARLLNGYAEKLEFPSDSFDAAIVAFGVRNFSNLHAGLGEMLRVLRPGGKLVVLEFSQPHAVPMRQLFFLYFREILPRIGRAISHHEHAYQYLPATVLLFPEGEAFLQILDACGFTSTVQKRLTFGIATIYTGFKPPQ